MSFGCETSKKRNVVVIGAGVVGLTTAVRIQEKGGYSVTAIAGALPTDPKSINYASCWAGAVFLPHARLDDELQQMIERETFETMNELAVPGGLAEHCFLQIVQSEYYGPGKKQSSPSSAHSAMPNFRHLDKSELVNGAEAGVAFDTLTIDIPVYLPYLLSRFLAAGGQITRGSVRHINEVIEGGLNGQTASPSPTQASVDAVVVCTALGTRSLGGVEDQNVFPLRGQTVIVRAPWIRFGRSMFAADGSITYIIPRRGGDVVVGGTMVHDDWHPTPRAEITKDILKRGFALCPELAPPEVRSQRAASLDDVRALIIEECCGLRPARKGGIRLEVDYVESPGRERVPIVFNYGHGSTGYQSSWGSASIALKLLEDAFS